MPEARRRALAEIRDVVRTAEGTVGDAAPWIESAILGGRGRRGGAGHG